MYPPRRHGLSHMESVVTVAMATKPSMQRVREAKDPEAVIQLGLEADFPRGILMNENLQALTCQDLAAFQDVFRLFSSGLTHTVDMRNMKLALHSAGIQLCSQEMREALRQADLDGQVKSSQAQDPEDLQTLFLQRLFKLLSQSPVACKSRQEMIRPNLSGFLPHCCRFLHRKMERVAVWNLTRQPRPSSPSY